MYNARTDQQWRNGEYVLKATEANFLEFLKKSSQFAIPIYQRTYSWTDRECHQLWADILRTGSNDAIPAHFTGSIVYIEKSLYQVTSQEPLLVIDGQQRLTTVMLILEALARHVGSGEPVDGFSAKKLRNYYLLNPEEEGERGFKLLLTQSDKLSLLALIQQKPKPAGSSLRITNSFEFFDEQIGALGSTGLVSLCKGLAKLTIVDVSLKRDQDNPQLIFESMNSTGRELNQADLIRNFILMGLEPSQQTSLYEEHWRPMEVAFGQEAYGTHFDAFMRHYLTVKTGEIPNVRAVYEAFKAHARSPEIAAAGVGTLVADIHTYAGYYCAMALDREDNDELAPAFRDLRELKVDVAFSLPAGALRRLCARAAPKNRLPRSRAVGGSLCVSPGRVRHPAQLAQQDFRDLRTRTQEKQIHSEHPGAPSDAAVLQALSERRGVYARAVCARPLQLPAP